MTNIYILKLQGGKYYVGKTDDIYSRYQQHLDGKGSYWTRKYKPLSVEKVIENASPFDEDKYVKEYMAKYGIDKVRGGCYVTETLDDIQEHTLQTEIWAAQDRCTNCGKKGHFVKNCKETRDINGKEIEYEDELVFACEYCDKEYSAESICLAHEKVCPKNRQQQYIKSISSNNNAAAETYRRVLSMIHPTSNFMQSVTCYRCDRQGHYASNCYANTNASGYKIDDDSDSDY
jgi:predicted GIY-YIG superfamily endonuclease